MKHKLAVTGLLLSTVFMSARLMAATAEVPTPPVAAPSASISNGMVKAMLWLPDVNDGFYRSTRFDWSGSIWSLQAGGHSYFGQWFPRYDPMVHDSITGPVEDWAPLNYDEAKPGESFVKVGVGVLQKIDDKPYKFSVIYPVLDHGKWTVKTGPDYVEYRHELNDPKSGYGYIYTKTVRLTKGKQQMTITQSLKNTGTKAIATNFYNHGFFMLDSQPTGPDITVTFPFEVKAESDMSPAAEVRGKQIVYLEELQNRPPRDPNAVQGGPAGGPGGPDQARGGGRGAARSGPPTGAQTIVDGFSPTDPKDFDIRVENHKTGAGLRITADRPLWKVHFWSTRATVCPEAYIEVKADPGKETSWQLTYDFYSLQVAAK